MSLFGHVVDCGIPVAGSCRMGLLTKASLDITTGRLIRTGTIADGSSRHVQACPGKGVTSALHNVSGTQMYSGSSCTRVLSALETNATVCLLFGIFV